MSTRLSRDKIIFKIRRFILRHFYEKRIHFGENLRILGAMPILKIPQNGHVYLGNNVVLNSDFHKSNTSLTTKVKFVTGCRGKIKIGNNCDLNGTCFVAYDELEVGDYCQFASSSLISDTDFHPLDPKIRLVQMEGGVYPYESVSKKKITIGNNVWIGWGVIILKGVTIGDNSVIGAGSVVTSNIPSNCLAVGNPAKVVRNI
jgi:acetyltransferase-like isoleucine patch superfamily enzyme